MHELALAPLGAKPEASLVDAVYESLLEAIVSGRLPSGAILSEVIVAQRLEVSRTPVHDAIRQLAKDGLIERANNRRARVARFTRDDVYEIFELRKCLEGPAAELAAGRMDRRQLGPLRTTADALAGSSAAPDWLRRWSDYDEQFHRTIAQASGNGRLARDICRYRLLQRGISKAATDVASLQGALQEHYDILSALEAHDGPRARAAMVAHIARWQDFFMNAFGRPG
jgi:DNA-binding GntR family transcriptional regulator